MNTSIIISYIALLLTVWVGLKHFHKAARALGLLDIPNHRSSHSDAKPRAGGVVFIAVWLIWLMIALVAQWVPADIFQILTPSLLVIAITGFVDDRFNLPSRWRFGCQLVAVVLFLGQLGGVPILHFGVTHLHFGLLGTLLAGLALLWSINLFNFMDGTDGIAATEAITVLSLGGAFCYLGAAPDIALLAWGLCAALIGFLAWNWPPAKLFMGDVGSTTLGFIIVALAFVGQAKHDLSIMPWVILYSAFVFDATATLLRRVLRGENWTQAHRSHAYQRLHQAGYTHRQVLLCFSAINLVLAVLAAWVFFTPNACWVGLESALLVCASSYFWVIRITAPQPTS